LNLLESDDDSECIFPLSPSAYKDYSNGKPVSAHPPHDTDMLDKDIHSRVTSAKDIQSASTSVSSPNSSIKMARKDCHFWLKKFEPGDQARDHKKEIGLWTIPEESQEQ
jgi:hypothetical protein